MEQIINYNAKNGQETCSINNINIHSSYNPEKEAERFVNLIEATINPSIIFITEPGFSYCAKYLKQRFPNSKLMTPGIPTDDSSPSTPRTSAFSARETANKQKINIISNQFFVL